MIMFSHNSSGKLKKICTGKILEPSNFYIVLVYGSITMMATILEFVHVTQFFIMTLRIKLYITYIDTMMSTLAILLILAMQILCRLKLNWLLLGKLPLVWLQCIFN